MPNTTDSFKVLAESYTTEADKFWGKGNSSAGTRARKALQELIKYARASRKSIQEEKTLQKSSKGKAVA